MSRLILSRVLGIGLVVGLAVGVSCGSSERPPAGKTCVINTDCNNPLACIVGKCHNQCIATRDCPAGQRCTKLPGGNVCQLEEEKRCPPGTPCIAGLTCALDQQCRNICTSINDCTTGQSCASGFCAEPMEVTPDGKLMVGGAGGAGGTGGAVGTGGAGGSPDAGVDAAPMMGLGPCGVPETEPNDTRDKAVPVAVPAMFTSCIGTRDDKDFYEITAPNDPAGGYFEYSITGVTTIETIVTIFSVTDNGEIDEALTDSGGQDLHGFLAAAPGQKYRLAISAFAGLNMPPEKYTVKITYTKVDDMFEPNDTRATAKPITFGTPIMSFMHGGYRSAALAAEEMQDWYVVMAQAGNIVVNLESVPTTVTGMITIVDSTGKTTDQVGGNDGQNVMETLEGVAAGPVLIMIRPFLVFPNILASRLKPPVTLPDQFTHPYKLTVTQ